MLSVMGSNNGDSVLIFSATSFRVALAQRAIASLADLARQSGISESYIRQIAGGYVPPLETRQLLASFLETTPEKIWYAVPRKLFEALSGRPPGEAA